jgi:hypothetical protein
MKATIKKTECRTTRIEYTCHTESAHDRHGQPLQTYIPQGGKVTEAISEGRKGSICHQHCLDELDGVYHVDKALREWSIFREGSII